MEDRPIVISPLKGIDQRSISAAPSAGRVRDMWYDPRGFWSSSGGYRRMILGPVNEGVTTNPFATVGAIESIHWFSQHNGARRWLIYVDGHGNLLMFDPSTAGRSGSPGDVARDRAGNAITRSIVPTPWQRSQSACWGDTFYLVNGIDRPVVMNGYFWDYAGWQNPAGVPSAATMNNPRPSDSGAPTIKMVNTGLGPYSDAADTDYDCGYRYRVSFVNDRGQESPLSAPSEMVTFTNASGKAAHFVKVTLPIGPPECVARRLYRTQNIYDASSVQVAGRGDQFFFHSEIPDNATGVIQDGLPDGSLAGLVDPTQLGVWPTNLKFLAPFKGCMFGTGADNSSVYFSLPDFPEVYPPDNVIDVGDAFLGPVTGMYATRNALVVFKATAIYLVKGNPVDGFFAETLTRETGCIAPNTIREVPGVGLVFLGSDAVNALQGALENEGVPTKVINIGVPIPTTLKRLNRSAVLNATAAVYHRDKEYWLCIPTVGYANNNLVMVYHYEIAEWSSREYFPVSTILETPDSRGYLLFGSYAATTGTSPDGIAHLGIMVYSRGFDDKDGTAIAPLYESGQISVSGTFKTFSPVYLFPRCILHGNNKMVLDVHTNRSQTSWYTGAVGPTPQPKQIQQYPQDLLPVYGTATFDTANVVWQQWDPGAIRFDLAGVGIRFAPIFEATVTLTPDTGKRWMSLLAVSMNVGVDVANNTVKPLKPDLGG